MAELSPGARDFWFIPLGGCGEIGMNMNLYGHAGSWLAVDCGVSFERDASGEHLIYPDASFIATRRQALQALVITHAHEDHIGAVAAVWPRLQCEVYVTPYAAAILASKLKEAGLAGQVPVRVVEPGERRQLGPFQVEWVEMTHSIAEPCALVIGTAAGKVLHTGDWKLDPEPLIGRGFDETRLKALANERLLAVVGDSTNAKEPGHSISEAEVETGLAHTIEPLGGRVIVTLFGSNVARLLTLERIARHTGRYLGLLGRSLEQRVAAARDTGYWPKRSRLIATEHLGYLPAHEVLVAATGSQGEARTALARLAAGNHPDLDLAAGDSVIFSARTIPGNELDVDLLVAKLHARGVRVIQAHSTELPIHASGHPCQQELRQLYEWVAPRAVIPVHGEPSHIQAHAELARAAGVPEQLTGRNGDLFQLAPELQHRPAVASVGRIRLQR